MNKLSLFRYEVKVLYNWVESVIMLALEWDSYEPGVDTNCYWEPMVSYIVLNIYIYTNTTVYI